MIKRLMIWLLKQFQKIADVLSGRQRMRSPNATQQITPVANSSETHEKSTRHSDVNINTVNLNSVAPVAKRVSLPTIPTQALEALERQAETPKDIKSAASSVGLSQTLVEDADIHRKLDATAAAISAEEVVNLTTNPTTQSAVSELLPSDLDTHTPVGDTAGSSLPMHTPVKTHSDYESLSIYDLLPAIEPEDSAGLDSPATTYQEHEPDAVTLEESIVVSRSTALAGSEEGLAHKEPVAGNTGTLDGSLDTQTVEQIALFSFDIYESEVSESEVSESEINGVDNVEKNEIRESIEVEREVSDVEERIESKASVSVSYEEIDELALLPEVKESLSLASFQVHDDREQINNAPQSEGEASEEPAIEAQAGKAQFNQLQLAQAQITGEYSVDEQLPEEVSQERAPTLEDSSISTSAVDPTAPVLEEPVPEKLDPEKSAFEKPVLEDSSLDKPEPTNPWLTAVPTARQEPDQTDLGKLESKSGTVKLLFTLKPGNYHGYIAPDDGSKDILFHQRYINADIFDKIERGTAVVATVKVMAGKAYATHVDLS